MHVLLLAFQGLNTLDLNGPIEVLGSSAIAEEKYFTITVAAADEITEAFEHVLIKREISFAELLDNKGKLLSKYDMLIVPGGPPQNVQKVIDAGDEGLMAVIRGWVDAANEDKRQRWLMSICTGSGFLGTLGILAGKTATAHWAYLDRLRSICTTVASERGAEQTEVVRKRWVDAGKIDAYTRLVTSGGVSCGIDCVLWMVGELIGMEKAVKIATVMDYNWEFGSVPVTQGQII